MKGVIANRDAQIVSLKALLTTTQATADQCALNLKEATGTWTIVYHDGQYKTIQTSKADSAAKFNAVSSSYAKVLFSPIGRIAAAYGGDEYRAAIVGYAYENNLVTPALYGGRWTVSGASIQNFDNESAARSFYNSQSPAYARVLVGADGVVKEKYGDPHWVRHCIGKAYLQDITVNSPTI